MTHCFLLSSTTNGAELNPSGWPQVTLTAGPLPNGWPLDKLSDGQSSDGLHSIEFNSGSSLWAGPLLG